MIYCCEDHSGDLYWWDTGRRYSSNCPVMTETYSVDSSAVFTQAMYTCGNVQIDDGRENKARCGFGATRARRLADLAHFFCDRTAIEILTTVNYLLRFLLAR
jgi:hypothetical protein